VPAKTTSAIIENLNMGGLPQSLDIGGFASLAIDGG
jgi:hypothetical protein